MYYIRPDGRKYNEIRPLSVTYNIFPYAAGSTLISLGETKVLCAVTLQPGVPTFLKGKKTGWLTAEYALLPTSTAPRTVREIQTQKRNGRAIEISRFIGRALRTIVALDQLGEYTILVDCDVLTADGSTRVASLVGAYLALRNAVVRWVEKKVILEYILTDEIAALSIGFKDGHMLLDVTCHEDNTVDADFNFVITRSEKLIEIQGGAEKAPISWRDYEQMWLLALTGARAFFNFYDHELP